MLYLLPTPLGNLADVTLRTLQALQECDVLLCEDTRVAQKLLLLLEQKGKLLKKKREFFSFHSHNQVSFLENISPDFFESCVGFMSDAGMPCVSDPGSILIGYAKHHKIPFEILPAGSAATLAHAYSGLGDSGFVFDGFLPHKSNDRQKRLVFWKDVLNSQDLALIVYESPHRLLDSLMDLQKIDQNCHVFVIKEMTKKFQASFEGNVVEVLQGIGETKILGEWVLVLKFSKQEKEYKLGVLEVMHSDIPPKIKAKLLSQITGESIKEWYHRIIKEGK
ncbi:16S rRNA (cytidine(1402)-2'-O)-methyltransferase [Helicobacter kayseriensis]|uniref:16S rRNA (cytidine(1402)-2'-O)-methyltransferase n=1 Tax=Helicobacter kayseriensis TaxID=2905877 RepID=UPI001E5775FA|nr:16S rRNA (cytidine(1402)-2'-O)-methyltransferase [Helicobacter kayseriensis]MCE3048374.1 16S rRNA (cytidine(1402)-2'-O)-methyltransferase [Helicobacter kayseriensis]